MLNLEKDVHLNLSQQMQHSPQLLSGILAAAVEDSERKTESPSRKRRKTSGGIVDLTNTPSPPPVRTWETFPEIQRTRRRSSTQRRISGDRARRSPGTRRRTRERNITRAADSPERRAFQPPHLMGRQIHPAAVLPNPGQQQPVIIDVDQIPVTTPVTMAPYAFPVCTGPHHLPVCSTAHVQMCNTQPTWSIPCTVQLPSCGVQHFPTCLQQVPLPQSLPPTMLHPSHHPTPQHIHQQHYPAPPPYYSGRTQQVQDNDVHLIGDHRPNYQLPPRIHPNMQLNPSPPIFLQEPTVHPSPHDLYGPYSRYYARRSIARSRLRPPPPTPYPGFLLHFLAMLSNPPVPPYGREHPDEASEVENYEALLNLAERLGEAKPRGLTKADIDQLPAYRFNSETRRSDLDMTSCVVCMCDFENRQLLRVLPCSHEFHGKCVDKWLKTNRTCPICRADASEVSSQSE
ncbi:hypothetical protein SNE40_007340 [Patella caerulea]|uniref:RING-type domain-containing protein n=2 Tax=Patella caerulea TaxID=87958 RepID=A0AAN8Q854_PATCE